MTGPTESKALKTVVSGLCFGEGPRWHDGRFYFSDMHADTVFAMDVDGKLEAICEVPGQPSGLGWLPDGRMLVVSMIDRRLLRLEADGTLSEHADLSSLATYHCNDMVVDAQGRTYVGNFGFNITVDEPVQRAAELVLVDLDGQARVVADELIFPNGAVITPDGETLIVGETFGGCMTAFSIQADGSLSDRREWARLNGAVPDGCCLDAEAGIWVASPIGHQVLRILEGGEVTERITVEHEAFACMLGGPERKTLYVCSAASSEREDCRAERLGRIEVVEVEVPGAGLP